MTLTEIKDRDGILSTLIHFKKDIFDSSISDEQLIILADKFVKYAVFVVASDGNCDVGFVSFYCNDMTNKMAFISMIIVGADFQHLGYGRKLFEEVCRISLDNGMKTVRLEVHKANLLAMRFYNNMGMVKISSTQNGCILEKKIGDI